MIKFFWSQTVRELLTKSLVIYYACQKRNAPLLHTMTMVFFKVAIDTTEVVVSWILQIASKEITPLTTRTSEHKQEFMRALIEYRLTVLKTHFLD